MRDAVPARRVHVAWDGTRSDFHPISYICQAFPSSELPDQEEPTMNQLHDSFVNGIFILDEIDDMKMFPDNCISLTVTSPPYDHLRTIGRVAWNDAAFQKLTDELKQLRGDAATDTDPS
jgi:hypothetical protein